MKEKKVEEKRKATSKLIIKFLVKLKAYCAYSRVLIRKFFIRLILERYFMLLVHMKNF